jgi:hypothetical protein
MGLEPSDGPFLHLVGEVKNVNGETRSLNLRVPVGDEVAEEIITLRDLNLAIALKRAGLFLVMPDGRKMRLPPEQAPGLLQMFVDQGQAAAANAAGN